MKVFIIAHDVGSKEMGMLFRPYYIAQGLKARGHKVEVITASYSRVRQVNPEIKKDLETHEVEGVPYHWIKSRKFSGNTLQRALGMFLFSFKLWWFAGALARTLKADAVIASSPHPLIIWGAHRIAKKTGGKLFFEVRDIWPLSIHELSGMSTRHPFYILCQWAEDYAYKHSKKVISLLPYAFDHMKTRGLTEDKFICIPNGFEDEDFKNKQSLPPELMAQLQEFKNRHQILVGYAGAHSLANSLKSVIEAFNLLRDQLQVGLVLIGDGAEKTQLMAQARSAGLTNILFLDPISKYYIPSVLGYFDIAYIGLKKSPLFKFGISPNKLIDYMAAEKPVLYAIDTDHDPVLDSGCGLRVPSGDTEALAQAILKMATMTNEERQELGRKGAAWIQANITYPRLLDKMVSVLQS